MIKNDFVPDYESYFKRLIVLNTKGIYLHFADGHTWLKQFPTADFDYQDSGTWSNEVYTKLRNGNIYCNDKIYGGILEAIDTIDEALQEAGDDPLLDQFYNYMHIGDGGVDHTRIERVDRGQGGLM